MLSLLDGEEDEEDGEEEGKEEGGGGGGGGGKGGVIITFAHATKPLLMLQLTAHINKQ